MIYKKWKIMFLWSRIGWLHLYSKKKTSVVHKVIIMKYNVSIYKTFCVNPYPNYYWSWMTEYPVEIHCFSVCS